MKNWGPLNKLHNHQNKKTKSIIKWRRKNSKINNHIRYSIFGDLNHIDCYLNRDRHMALLRDNALKTGLQAFSYSHINVCTRVYHLCFDKRMALVVASVLHYFWSNSWSQLYFKLMKNIDLIWNFLCKSSLSLEQSLLLISF